MNLIRDVAMGGYLTVILYLYDVWYLACKLAHCCSNMQNTVGCVFKVAIQFLN